MKHIQGRRSQGHIHPSLESVGGKTMFLPIPPPNHTQTHTFLGQNIEKAELLAWKQKVNLDI